MTTKKSVLFSTNQNSYCFNKEEGFIFYIHPLVNFFAKEKLNIRSDVTDLRLLITSRSPELNNYSNTEIKYYYEKYMHLITIGAIDTDIKDINQYELSLSDEVINHNLVNIRQIVFEVTDKCNLSCKYCGYGELYDYYDERLGNNMEKDIALKTIKYFETLWKSTKYSSFKNEIYISFYGGEPLLNMPLITEVVNYIKSLALEHIQFIFSMTTNGILLDKYIPFLVDNNFKLLISLDGNKSNNIYRTTKNGKNSFRSVYNNACLIRKEFPNYFKKNVRFNAVLHNKNSVSEIVNYFNSEFNKMPRIGELSLMGVAKDKKDEFIEMYMNYQENAEV